MKLLLVSISHKHTTMILILANILLSGRLPSQPRSAIENNVTTDSLCKLELTGIHRRFVKSL